MQNAKFRIIFYLLPINTESLQKKRPQLSAEVAFFILFIDSCLLPLDYSFTMQI